MTTNRNDLPIRDAHAHFFSRNFLQILASQMKEPPTVEAIVAKLGWDLPPADNTELASRWVEELDKHGVAQIALMASIPGDEASVADAVRAYPDRIHGYFMLNPAAPDAIARATNALDKLGLRGICLFPAMHRYRVHDERVQAVCELAAERKGVVVFVHMGVLTVGVRNKLGLASKFDLSCSNPIDLHRVALDHPKVNFVVPHFGAGFFREVLMLGDLAPNVHLDTSSTNSWVKYQTPPIDLKAVFAKALEIFGPRRLLFGSDSSFFPRGWNAMILEVQRGILRDLAVSEDDTRAIVGGNLQRLLGA